MGRILGVDLGSRRIGLAVSDPTGTIASPHDTLVRSGDVEADHAALVAVAREVGADRIVVGLPRSLDGRSGPAARAVAAEVEQLRRAAPDLVVSTHDERLSTVSADRHLAESGVRARRRRSVIDQTAAAVILQSYLEAHRESAGA